MEGPALRGAEVAKARAWLLPSTATGPVAWRYRVSDPIDRMGRVRPVYGGRRVRPEESLVELHDLLHRRQSSRDFRPKPVSDDDLVELLWAAQGATSHGRRTTPSAQGRYPLQLVVARGPRPAGTWTWESGNQVLRARATHDVRSRLAAAAIGDQPWIGTAPVTVALCADVGGMVDHFAHQPPGDRGRRYVDVEIGAAVQNLALSATARGLAGVIVGGFDDALVADILELGALEPRLLFSLGQPG